MNHSLHHQLVEAYANLSELRRKVGELYVELSQKVALNNVAGQPAIGRGTVSSDGVNVTGKDAFFTKFVKPGTAFIVGNERVVVKSVTNDNQLTVEPALKAKVIDSIYAIQNANEKREWNGLFAFGNEKRSFKGVIKQDSSLVNNGRATNAFDVATIDVTKRKLVPVSYMVSRIINREGDYVSGSDLKRIKFKFVRCKLSFANQSFVSTKTYPSKEKNFATMGYLLNFYRAIKGAVDQYAYWSQDTLHPGVIEVPFLITGYPRPMFSSFKKAQSTKGPMFISDEFVMSDAQDGLFVAERPCKIFAKLDVTTDSTLAHALIYHNSKIISENVAKSGKFARITTSASCSLYLNKGDRIGFFYSRMNQSERVTATLRISLKIQEDKP